MYCLTGMDTEVLALPSEDSLPLPRAQQNPQEISGKYTVFNSEIQILYIECRSFGYILFAEQNMERLSALLDSSPCPAEPERSAASSWSVRQQKASDRWEEARPYHLRCLLESEAVGKPLCCFCHKPAVIRLDVHSSNNKVYLCTLRKVYNINKWSDLTADMGDSSHMT